tara:strand:+ start:934 stop:1860 length:927 start_codon:yes stop_codon:yes gene_type:complete
MNEQKISIIIPVYNVEKYVKETLISVKNQSSKPDEVIIINDGSTDNSFNIVKDIKDTESWKMFETRNQGLGLTRNYGKSLAKGDYIYFLDSDDILEQNFIHDMRKLIKDYDQPDVILFSGKIFSNNEIPEHKINLNFSIDGQYFQGDSLLTNLVKRKETLPQASRYLSKKSLWSKNNLSYPAGIAEDEAIFFPLISLSKNTVISKNSYYRYRVDRPGSITLDKVKSSHAEDYLNRILFTINFMQINREITQSDHSAWNYNLERKCLKYVNLCLKTKTDISWKSIFRIFLRSKNFIFLLKIMWRILKRS